MMDNCGFLTLLFAILSFNCQFPSADAFLDEILPTLPFSHLINKELEQFKQQLQTSFKENLREKRSYGRSTYDVKLDPSNNFLEARVSSPFAYTFVCQGKGFVIQSDGIYRLDFFTQNVTTPNLKKVNTDWSIGTGDRVLHVQEWEQKCFVVVANQNGSFSSIYTLHGDNLSPIFRQQIRNNGFVTSAKFFILKKALYLVVTNDNAVHALTICPVFRWAGTYMDRIHSIQTRGAIAIETFTINSKEYIAIAQSQDSSGNFEVGTQILRMDAKEELEKVQLLWSNQPVALQYVEVLEQHYLVIGQAKESSLVYLFAGIDFVQVQTLDGYFGPKLFMDFFLLPQPDKGPVLLSAKPASVQFYTWSTTSRQFVLNSNNSALSTVKSSKPIISAKFIRPASSQVYLTIVQNENNRPILKVYPVILERKDIAESQIKQTESQLAQCLFQVRKKLDEDSTLLPSLMTEKDNILTLSNDTRFQGTIIVSNVVKANDPQTKIQLAEIVPEYFEQHDPVITPSALLARILQEQERLKSQVLDQLPNVLMSNKPGVISGDYTFLTELEIRQLNAPNSNLDLEVLNNASISDIKEFALRKSPPSPQHILGAWSIKKLSANEITVPSNISDVEISNFLLKKCPKSPDIFQELSGELVFKKDIKFVDGVAMFGDGIVNGIIIANVVLKNSPIKDIKGFKHAQNMEGGDGFTFNFINDKNFPEWYESVLHIKGEPQSSTGVKTISSKGNKIQDLNSATINGRDWEEFNNTVLRNIGDQVIEGDLQFERLDVDSIEADSIGDVEFKNLLSTNGSQHIFSNITLGTLTIVKDLHTGSINGLSLIDLAVKKNEEVEILGPVELQNFQINGNVTLDELITIEGKDISEIAKLRRKQVYFSTRSKTITLRAPVEAQNLDTKILNGHTWDDFENNFWSRNEDNVIQVPLNLKGRKVSVLNKFTTTTLNGLHLEEDLVRTDSSEPILAQMNFLGDVFVEGDIHQADGRTLNGLDFSEISQSIVRVGDGRVITGKKSFKSKIVASKGAEIGTLNGFSIPEDLILLNSNEPQFIGGQVQFKNKAQIDVLETEVDIQIGGKVNKVDLLELKKTTAFKNEPVLIKGNVVFNTSFSASWIHVRRLLNGINATDLFKNIIYLNEEQVIKFPVRVVRGQVTAKGPSLVKTINGIVLDDYFRKVVQSRDEAPSYRINGTKTFLNLEIDGDLLCDHLNGISLLNLSSNSLSKSLPQNVTGKFIFKTITVDGDLEVENINGLNASDLVFINDPETCTIKANVTFLNNVVVEGPLTIGGFLNGHPVDDILAEDQSGLHDREFSDILVLGNLDWDNNREDIQGISNFFENAVTLDTDQEISGPVVFADGFDADEVTAQPWIDNIDLKEIWEDAIQPGEIPLEFRGNNTFSKKLVIKDSLVVQNLQVNKINGVNVRNLDKIVVRKGSKGTVYGIKYFANGLDVEDLKFKDLGNKGDYNWLVTTSDNRTIDSLELSDLTVENDFKFNRTKDINLEDFLANRVTRSGDQVLLGNYTVPSLTVEEDCHISSVNGIKVSDIFFNNGTERQKIDGKKTFKNGVAVEGDVETSSINGFNFKAIHKDVYRTNINEKVDRPIIFIDPVLVNDSIQVQNHINDYRPEDLSSKFEDTLKTIETRAAEYSESPSAESLVQIEKMKARLSDAPFWLEFLRLKQDWSILGPQSRVEFTQTPSGGILGLHQSIDIDGVSWPEGCQCNAVRFVDIEGPSISTNNENFFPCNNAFVVTSPLKNIYSIFDHSLSYNQTCNTNEEAQLVVANASDSSGGVLLKEPTKGYLSDVKAFSAYGKDYLVLAYYFSSKTKNHDSSTYIYRVGSKSLSLVQTIPTSGPIRLAVKPVKDEWMLAIANNQDPKTNSCLTNSGIYRWSAPTQNFILLREVKTNGAVDVTFIEAEDRGANYKGAFLSFIAFAQSGNSGDGEVLILQYDNVLKNYYTFQSMRSQWSVTAVDYLCVQENCYLITVIPQTGVHFYEYRYVEGFQNTLSVPIVGARDITAFSWGENNERIIFAIASSKSSLLAEGIIAGYSYQEYDDEYGIHDLYENTPISLQFVEPY